VPLVHELGAAPAPWDALQRLSALPRLLFLDSALDHPHIGRYSFIAADPPVWLSARRGSVTVSAKPVPGAKDPFAVLADYLRGFACSTLEGLPPFQGGAAGLFSYDLCHHLERLPRPKIDEFAVPDLAVGLYDWVLAFDHQDNRAWIFSTGFPHPDPRPRLRQAEKRMKEVAGLLQRKPKPRVEISNTDAIDVIGQWPVGKVAGLSSNFTRSGYLQAVERVLDYIRAGDCFQVNLAQRLLSPVPAPPLELYRRLREQNPAPFAGYLDAGDFAVVSASPERFLCLRNGEAQTRPIKGTRARGPTPLDDQAQIQDLTDSAKDRAENVMIVDLLRNDLGRVCDYGTVRATEVCRVETHPYVHHLVSEVRGRLRPGLGPIDLLRAAFPGGSVTGAPKIRAMEIIAELEPHARGPYCGSLGYIGFDGNMDTSILIRTGTLGRGWLQFPVGAGIVADSAPQREYDETWDKAEGLLRALG
jgi:para-aminobenzoate synthetase component 1